MMFCSLSVLWSYLVKLHNRITAHGAFLSRNPQGQYRIVSAGVEDVQSLTMAVTFTDVQVADIKTYWGDDC